MYNTHLNSVVRNSKMQIYNTTRAIEKFRQLQVRDNKYEKYPSLPGWNHILLSFHLPPRTPSNPPAHTRHP